MKKANSDSALNDELFEIMRGVKSRRIKPDQARVMSNVAGRIISNAKLSLAAAQAKSKPSLGFWKNGRKA